MPKNNLFRLRALCISLLASTITCGFAFSASPHPMHPKENFQPTPAAIDVDAATLTSYQGQYATDADPDRIYSFFYEDGKFSVESARSAKTYLIAESKTSFTVKDSQTHFNFVVDRSGKVTGATIGAGNNTRLAKRISDHPVHNHFRP